LNLKNEMAIELFDSKEKSSQWTDSFMVHDLNEIRTPPQSICIAIQQIEKDLLLGKSLRGSRVKNK
jgi:hypothetical protein